MITRRNKEESLYAVLHRQALQQIQALSGNRWTDFNVHDPGVTILEAAHYALLELQYRLDFPLETYLPKQASKRKKTKASSDYSALGLLSAGAMKIPSIVTKADYEALFRQRINAVTDVITDCRVSLDEGKYHIRLVLTDDKLRKHVEIQLIEIYHAHRNIGETLGKIDFKDHIDHPAGELDASFPGDVLQCEPKEPETDEAGLFSSEYYSFQNHFPDCYGINEKGISPQSTPEHQAKIRQLKAYLLIYDFLMANTLLQVENMAGLLCLPPHSSPKGWGGIPDFSVTDMDRLIDTQRLSEYPFPSPEFVQQQQAGVLDLLDMLYGEDTAKMCEEYMEMEDASSLRKRAELIRFLPQYNANRFRSFNILNDSPSNTPFVLHLVSCVFGKEVTKDIYWIEHILLSNNPDERNRLTVVLHIRLIRLVELDKLETFIRERLPAHLSVRFICLRHEKMLYFKSFHRSWRRFLFAGDNDDDPFQGDTLLSFLENEET